MNKKLCFAIFFLEDTHKNAHNAYSILFLFGAQINHLLLSPALGKPT